MKYMGSKRRIAKYILPIILENIGDNYFVDLFTGGGNLIMYANCKNKIANDINPYSIAFLKKIQKDGCNWLPENNKDFTEENYNYVKAHKDKFNPAFLGHVGFNLSYGGKWFNSPRRDSKGLRDYIAEAYREACKQAEMIKDVTFLCFSYEQVKLPENSIIYCDIPYKDTGKYQAVDKSFDYDKFYAWCRIKSNEGHKIFISEYNMPSDFTCVWEKEHKVQIANSSNSIMSVERLFIVK